MINIKDYLPYYIGCPCTVERNDGKTIEDIVCFSLLQEIGIPGKLPHQYYTIKPHLRRLSDMSEEEARELAKLQSDTKYHDGIDILGLYHDHVHYMDGSMWSGNGVQEYNDLYVYFQALQPDQFHYLLKQGFDLFGLVDAGLAIDSKTLNQ